MPDIRYSQRGFAQLDTIETDRKGGVRVYESSSAEGAAMWLKVNQEPWGGLEESETIVHMKLRQAIKVRDAMTQMIEQVKSNWNPVATIGVEDRVTHENDYNKYGTVTEEQWTEDGQKYRYVVEWDNGQQGAYWRDQLFLVES